MQTVKFSYSGSATRKLTVMGRDQVIISGDDKSTQFIFKFPDSYQSYSKEIVWDGFYITNGLGEDSVARYPLVNDTFYVPQEITLPNSGKEISFQVVMYKPQIEGDDTSFQITESTELFPVYVSKSARGEQTDIHLDSVTELVQRAYVNSAYDVDSGADRPIITFTSLGGLSYVLALDMPYLDGSGTIAEQFLPPGSEVKVWHVDYMADLENIQSANSPDLAIIDVGTEGSQTDYQGNIFVKIDDQQNLWTLIYSKYTVDQIQPIYQDIDSLESRMDTAEGDIDSLEGRMDTAESNISTNQSDIDSLESRMDTAESDIDSLEGRMDTAESNISTNASDIDSLEGRMDTAESDIDSLESRMGTAESDIDSLEGRMDTAESDIDQVEGRLDTAETDIDSLEGRMDTAESDIDSLEGRMNTAEGNISTIEGQIGTEQTSGTILYRIKTNETSISTINSEIGDSQTQNTIIYRLDTAESNISTNTSNISSINEEIGTEETSGTILYRIKTNETDISSLDGRLDTAETKLQTIQEGAEVNVQSDWTDANTESDQYILNKPTLGTAQAKDYVQASSGQSNAGYIVQLDSNGKIDESMLNQHVTSVNTRTGAVTLTKADVGLTNTDDGAKIPVDNLTSSTNPPLASTVQTALDGKINQLPSNLTGAKILVSIQGDQNDIAESSYSTDKLQYLANVTSDIQTQINNKVQKNADITAGTQTKITYDAKGLVTGGTTLSQSDIPNLQASKITTGQFDLARLPSDMGVVYVGSITQDGTSTSWTFPVTPYDTDISHISIRDSNGYEVRMGVQYGTGTVTLSTAEPPASGTTFSFKVIAPTQ